MIIRVIGILSKEQKYISLLNLKTETSINIHPDFVYPYNRNSSFYILTRGWIKKIIPITILNI